MPRNVSTYLTCVTTANESAHWTHHDLANTCRSATEYEKILKVNVVGPYLTTINFLPLLRQKKSRVVVNMSSGLGSITQNRQGSPVANKWVAYNASSENSTLPCSALPCPALPCPALPCPALLAQQLGLFGLCNHVYLEDHNIALSVIVHT